ncbi:UDP-glucose 4-epimerase GalE [Endozoicomonas sp. 8E]|nr:UDP-glucose 4-epimerase GalE [Endozoicomonas sp. 8E]
MMLITGGAGYIGSHTCVALLESGCDLVVLDNLCNSSKKSLARVEQITGKKLRFEQGDIRDPILLDKLFARYPIDTVVHFAGLKGVAESVADPLNYYNNNVFGSSVLFRAMQKARVNKIVFSSSATVYGQQTILPVPETATLSHASPYGHTKLMIEEMLDYIHKAEEQSGRPWGVALLRYFNPIGAHSSGLIGEDPWGIPNNLLPYITQVAAGIRPHINLYTGYDTRDGSGVRDYIHVVDLARGHVKAIEKLQGVTGVYAWNLGVGQGYSTFEVLDAFERGNKLTIPREIHGRRAGDVDSCYADVSKARKELGWVAEHRLDDMVRDAWNWQKKNPNGY